MDLSTSDQSLSNAAILLFDDECMLCRSLAQFARQKSPQNLETISWQAYRTTEDARSLLGERVTQIPASELRVVVGQQVLEKEDAWLWLLNNHPRLASLDWMARKLNIQPALAKTLNQTTKKIRRLCPWCRRW